MPILRPATRADLPAILAISNHYARTSAVNLALDDEPLALWAPRFEAAGERHPWWVAEVDGAVVGFAKAAPWNSRGAYDRTVEVSVYARHDVRQRGIGRALYARLFPQLRTLGHRAVLAGITLPNPASVRLHEAFGMRQVACYVAVGFKFGAWHDVGYWQLSWPDGPDPR